MHLLRMPVPRSVLVPLIVACALFMETTDSTIISTALPAIAKDIGEDPISLKLALTSYLVSLAVFIPISGWIADRFGARNVFRLAIGVFMAGSLMCAASDSLASFVVARFVQGLGGSMMVPVGRLVLLRSVPKADLVKALAYLTTPALVGPVIGPPLGGFITTYFDWRWIFFINIPIGLLGIALSTIFMEDVREDERTPLDLVGFALSGFGLSALMLGLSTGGKHLVSSEISIGCIAAGIASILLYLRHARRTPEPLLKLSLLSVPTYRASVVGGFLFRVGVGAGPFLLPLMLQLGFGLTPLQSGLITFVSSAGALFVKTVAIKVLRAFGFRRVLTVNALLTAVLIGAPALFTPATPLAVMLVVLFLGGSLRSLQFTAINAVAYADISKRDMSYATSLASVGQQLALSTGVALGAAALEGAAAFHGHAAVQTSDFSLAFWAVAAVSALSVFMMATLAHDAGAEVSGHRHTSKGPAAAEPVAESRSES